MPIGARPAVTYWQDWANLALGVWLFVSPWLLGYVAVPAAAWNSWVCGIVAAAMAVASLIQYARWVEWVNVAVGVWLVVSPWVLAFAWAGEMASVFNHVVVGLLVGVLALWDVLAHGNPDRMVWE